MRSSLFRLASIEQHGNHLPVNTDTNCCFTIAQRTAQAIDEFPVLVLPPIWTGYSPHHMSHPGSITLKYHTFVELLTQVAVSVHAHGFKKILFLNGHAGNSPVIAAMRTKLAAEEGFSSLGYNYWDLPSVAEEIRKVSVSDKGFIGHSGEIETSLQLYSCSRNWCLWMWPLGFRAFGVIRPRGIRRERGANYPGCGPCTGKDPSRLSKRCY